MPLQMIWFILSTLSFLAKFLLYEGLSGLWAGFCASISLSICLAGFVLLLWLKLKRESSPQLSLKLAYHSPKRPSN